MKMFEARLDRHWRNQKIKFDYEAEVLLRPPQGKDSDTTLEEELHI